MRQKSKTKFWFVAFLLMAVLGLSGIASANQDFRSLLAEKIADKIPVEEILGLLQPIDEAIGLNVITSSNTGLTNVRIGGQLQQASSETQTYYKVTQVDIEPWPAATTTLSVANNRTATSTASVMFVNTASTVVSSSFYMSCGTATSTASTGYVAYDETNRLDNLIDDYGFVTSTAPIVISSADSDQNGTNGRSRVEVGPSKYVTCFAQNYNLNCVNNSSCEQVTSTSRGWKGYVVVDWLWQEGF